MFFKNTKDHKYWHPVTIMQCTSSYLKLSALKEHYKCIVCKNTDLYPDFICLEARSNYSDKLEQDSLYKKNRFDRFGNALYIGYKFLYIV